MDIKKYLLLAFLSTLIIPVAGQPPVLESAFNSLNNPIAFDKVNANIIRDAVGQVIKITDSRVKDCFGLKPGVGPEVRWCL